MVEVFTVGVLLSLVRLAGWPTRRRGPGLFALGAMTVALRGDRVGRAEAPVVAACNEHGGRRCRRRLPRLRELRPGVAPTSPATSRAPWSSTARAAATSCTRPSRIALQRTWACVVAAAILYIPANVLPVMDNDLGLAARRAHAARRHPRALARRLVGPGDHRLHRQHRRAGAEDRGSRPARVDGAPEAGLAPPRAGRACTG